MNFRSLEEILEFAIDKEEEAAAFYEDVARRAPFSGAKKVLQGFIVEEQKHRSLLEDFRKDEGKLREYNFEWIPDLKRSDYMVDTEYQKDMDYRDLLRLAMKREEKSLALYNELQEKTDVKEFVDLFKMLAQEEAKHKLALETLYDDYMAEQGD